VPSVYKHPFLKVRWNSEYFQELANGWSRTKVQVKLFPACGRVFGQVGKRWTRTGIKWATFSPTRLRHVGHDASCPTILNVVGAIHESPLQEITSTQVLSISYPWNPVFIPSSFPVILILHLFQMNHFPRTGLKCGFLGQAGGKESSLREKPARIRNTLSASGSAPGFHQFIQRILCAGHGVQILQDAVG